MPMLDFKAYFILAEQDSVIHTDNPSQLLHSLSSLFFFFLLKSDAGQHPVLAKGAELSPGRVMGAAGS